MHKKLLVAAMCAVPFGFVTWASPVRAPVDPALGQLLADTIERNAIGDEVALSKWYSGKPVQDSQREAAVLADVQAKAAGHGLPAASAVRFFAAQIEANKLVQYALLDQWERRDGAPERRPPDLEALRKRLDVLQDRLLIALASSEALRQSPSCRTIVAKAVQEQVDARGLDSLHRVALQRGLGDFCPAGARR